MKVLELINALEEAYDRFGDIDIQIHYKWLSNDYDIATDYLRIRELIIESEEFIIECGE